MVVAPLTPTVPESVLAEAPVKVTVPKSAKPTRLPFCSKSSTIHSALVSQREAGVDPLLKVCETFWPLVVFSMTAVPPVRLDAVTVTVMESPAEREIPEKSKASLGYHSYQAP